MHALRGKYILVTRPAHQASALCTLIEQAGGLTVHFPTIAIQAVENVTAPPLTLKQYHIILFTSSNAVELGLPYINTYGSWPQHWQIGAIGQASANKLNNLQHPPHIVPTTPYSSETLLAQPALQHVSGLNILIIRGVGGRTLLADTLRQRGAQVHYLEVYRRCKPTISDSLLIKHLKTNHLSVVTASSPEGLHNLLEMLSPTWHKSLLALPIVVVSQKMCAQARNLGFKNHVFLSANATDQSIMATIIRACGQ